MALGLGMSLVENLLFLFFVEDLQASRFVFVLLFCLGTGYFIFKRTPLAPSQRATGCERQRHRGVRDPHLRLLGLCPTAIRAVRPVCHRAAGMLFMLKCVLCSTAEMASLFFFQAYFTRAFGYTLLLGHSAWLVLLLEPMHGVTFGANKTARCAVVCGGVRWCAVTFHR